MKGFGCSRQVLLNLKIQEEDIAAKKLVDTDLWDSRLVATFLLQLSLLAFRAALHGHSLE